MKARPFTALAVAAHPDDIEFYMAGTLLLLKKAGCEIHYMTVANGSCGSIDQSAAATVFEEITETLGSEPELRVDVTWTLKRVTTQE